MREPRYSIPSLWQQTKKLSNRNISSVSTMNTHLQNVTHTEIRCLDPEELRKLLSEQNSDVSHSWCPLKARLVGEIKSAPCILGSIYCVVPHVICCIKWCTHFPSRIKLISFNYSKLGFHSKVCHYLPLSKKIYSNHGQAFWKGRSCFRYNGIFFCQTLSTRLIMQVRFIAKGIFLMLSSIEQMSN